MALFRTEDLVFQNLIRYPDLTVAEQKMTFLTGESGCGKSTLLKLFNGVLSPSAGSVFFGEENIQQLDPVTLRREAVLVSQEPYLFQGTILDNFNMYYDYRELPVPELARIKQCLQVCCLEFEPEHSCDLMSGGEKQRVFNSILLSLLPTAILLDEPTAALDDGTADQFFTRLKAFATEEGITVVVICHSPSLVEKFHDHIIHLERRTGDEERS